MSFNDYGLGYSPDESYRRMAAAADTRTAEAKPKGTGFWDQVGGKVAEGLLGGFLGAATNGATTRGLLGSGLLGGSEKEDPTALLAKLFLERELSTREKSMSGLSSLSSEATRAFS